ncbi:AbiEi antitoxin N-terminal domain-containing protein [Achromobacter sp. DH1f]|uniref:AbiEi antitoxin N-terminal domain-containing protein n=1 Tax=Achromobacter sp. DH1f TaxID=1397275 RepID=UPI00046A2F95|nr:AbiEi antitoxin N-terminal domain-containing protein [Achromobacter sp. DH1f]
MRGDGPLKRLNTEVVRGSPLGTEELAGAGVSPALANYYVKTGWLRRLGRGAFAFPADELAPYKCVAFLQAKWPRMHLGGAAALRARGLRTPWADVEEFEFWGLDAVRLPEWFTERFTARYVQRAGPAEIAGRRYAPSLVEIGGALVLASEPEQAILELLTTTESNGPAGQRALVAQLGVAVPLRADVMASAIATWPRAGVRAAAAALIRREG